jgi:hypothetical protein
MSVQILDNNVYEALYIKVDGFKFVNTCNINYSHTFRAFNEAQSKKFIRQICWLNEWSYNARYKEEETAEYKTLKFSKAGLSNLNTIQFYKYLQCIQYNIEVGTIKEYLSEEDAKKFDSEYGETLKTLEDAINDLATTIVQNSTNYNDLKWSSL